MRIFVFITTFFIASSVFAQNITKEIEATIGINTAAKLIGFINFQHYGESGNTPQNEQQLLATCSSPALREVEEMVNSQKKMVKRARNSAELLALADSSSLDDIRSNYKTRQQEVLENAIPRVIGYCDLKNAPARCNRNDDSCSAVNGAYEVELKKVLNNESALRLSVRSLCDKLVKAIAEGHKTAVSELEMCRLDNEETASKNESSSTTVSQKKNSSPNLFTIEVGGGNKIKNKLNMNPDLAPAKINFKAKGVSAQ